MSETPPLISIITSTLNAVDQLPRTAVSVAAQRGASFEWIVVDGGSTDGTQALLRQHEYLIARWLSEPDNGIYDAWNKACALARGEWLLFLGAGDEFPTPDTLAVLSGHLSAAHPVHDLVYGKLIYISQAGRQDLEEVGQPWAELAGSWELGRPALPPHAATFHHRSLFAGGQGFDARYRLAGDAHFLLRYALRKPPLHVSLVVCRTPIGGVTMSLRNVLALAREIRTMNRELVLVPPLGHRLIELLLLVAKVVVGLMPAPVGHRIADWYRRLIGQPQRWSVR